MENNTTTKFVVALRTRELWRQVNLCGGVAMVAMVACQWAMVLCKCVCVCGFSCASLLNVHDVCMYEYNIEMDEVNIMQEELRILSE